MTPREDQRTRFYRTIPQLLDEDERRVLVLAEIGSGYISSHARVINVGIREQLMVSFAGGLALEGMRPIVHTFAPFLVERPFEQIKLDLGHQGVGAVLVSAGGSYSMASAGETHFGHRDVALLDTLDGWTVHVPGTADEAEAALRSTLAGDDKVYIRLDGASNSRSYSHSDGFAVLKQGRAGTVIAVGPTADNVFAATSDFDVTVLYAHRIRPFDAEGLRANFAGDSIAIVEPYLAGTSVKEVSDAVSNLPHRILALGVGREELRRYGSPREHERAHGLDVASIRSSIVDFFGLRVCSAHHELSVRQ